MHEENEVEIMKFGKVDDPSSLNLNLPKDHEDTIRILTKNKDNKKAKIRIGCAKWNKYDLKNFYPKGVGNKELEYYSSRFNSIEFNAFFYRIFPPEMVKNWYYRSSDNFTFFPKIPQTISQFRRLKDCDDKLDQYFKSIINFKEKLGTCFLQMHPSFKPDSFDDLVSFIEKWPSDIKLSIEMRHTDWYNDPIVYEALQQLLVEYTISSTITDTAGRRDLIHMRLSTPTAFIRFTGANHESDYVRLDEWFERIKSWIDAGLNELNFFIHQNVEVESPLLASYFIERLNQEMSLNLVVPKTISPKN